MVVMELAGSLPEQEEMGSSRRKKNTGESQENASDLCPHL